MTNVVYVSSRTFGQSSVLLACSGLNLLWSIDIVFVGRLHDAIEDAYPSTARVSVCTAAK